MNTLLKEFKAVTENLIDAKKRLDKIERHHALTKATVMTSIFGQYTNQDARENACLIEMESTYQKLLDDLYDARGDVKELSMRREVIWESLKERRINSND